MKSLILIVLLAVVSGMARGLIKEYIFHDTLLDWYNAQTYCRKNYKDMANVTTIEENKQLLETGSPSEGWLGLHINLSITKEPFFTNWCDTCPNKTWRCVYINILGLWNTTHCKYTKAFYCYRFLILVKENKTWEEADQFCRTHYTGLASVTSPSSLNQLNLETVEAQTESVWTGLRFINGKWLWVSKEELGSLVSMPSCPDPSYRCGALDNTTNTLKNHNCNDKLNFICYSI